MGRFLSNKEKHILQFINEYGCATKEQVKHFTNASDRNLENLIKGQFIRKDKKSEIYLARTMREPDEKMIIALEILSFFKDDMEWHSRADFPFKISFFMHEKVFDITVVLPGEELLMSAALNRSGAERILVGLKNKNTILHLEKFTRYYIYEEKMFFCEENGTYFPDEEFTEAFFTKDKTLEKMI